MENSENHIKKYLFTSYSEFVSKFNHLKTEWLKENEGAKDMDFNTFYWDLYKEHQDSIPKYTFREIESFLHFDRSKIIEGLVFRIQCLMRSSTDVRDLNPVANHPFIDKWFDGDSQKLRLIIYLVQEFEERYVSGRVTRHTMFDQLYRYLNYNHNKTGVSIAKEDYKSFINTVFEIEYISVVRGSADDKYIKWFKKIESEFIS